MESGSCALSDSFSIEDLSVIEKVLKDKKLLSELIVYGEKTCDHKHLQYYENELRKYESERGVDVHVISANPGITLQSRDKNEQSDVLINISVSEKVDKPNFSCNEFNAKKGYSWLVPHAVSPSKIEKGYTTSKSVADILNRCEDKVFNKTYINNFCNSIEKNGVTVYDVIVNPLCLDLARKNTELTQHLIQTAIDGIAKTLNKILINPKIIGYSSYIGSPSIYLTKSKSSPSNQDVYTCNSYERNANISNAPNSLVKPSKLVKNAVPPFLLQRPANSKRLETLTPKYKVKYVDNISLQDCANINHSQPLSLRPNSLKFEFELPKVFKASEIEVKVCLSGKLLSLKTCGNERYYLDIPVDYAIEEEPEIAQFDVSTHILILNFLTLKTQYLPLSESPPSSADSGIECEHGYRTSSDGDNSSVSSQEELFECDNKLAVIVDKPVSYETKSAQKLFKYMSYYKFSQTNCELVLHIPDVNIKGDVHVSMPDTQTASFQYSSVGGGLMPLLYEVIIEVKPYHIKEDGVASEITDDALIIRLKKEFSESWESIKIGSDFDDIREIKLEQVPELANLSANYSLEEEDISNRERNLIVNKTEVLNVDKVPNYEVNAVSGESESMDDGELIAQVRNERSRHVSESSITGSWPRGILKNRSSSLSESLDDSLPSSIEDKEPSVQNIEEDDECFEEEEFPKKCVRFNDVVSKQVFRYGSSILGQRAKNQRRAQNKKRNRERRTSEGDIPSNMKENWSNFDTCLSDPGKYDSTTDGSNDEITESDDAKNRVKEFLKETSFCNKKGARKQKGKKNRKKKGRSLVELSNDMIFQLDDA